MKIDNWGNKLYCKRNKYCSESEQIEQPNEKKQQAHRHNEKEH